jgi:hypothetical protein
MARLSAIIIFAATYAGFAALMIAVSRMTQPDDGPSLIAIPMLAVALATLPACGGFALGVLLRGGKFSFPKCMLCALAAGILAIAASQLVTGLAAADLVGLAAASIFIICAFLPKLASHRVRLEIKPKVNGA